MDNKIENGKSKDKNVRNDYFIGLDVGTDSVGWAVTDTEYRLKKAGGKPLWGAYLFAQAETAENRRGFRTGRRRTARTRYRLRLLQSLFGAEIEKVDPTFFIRLNNSALFAEDKDDRIATKYILFGDADYNDKDYFKQFPTIFHLRKYLTENAPQDIRLLYLACHHIIKSRGHFLFDNENMNVVSTDTVRMAFCNINAALAEGVTDDEQFDASPAFSMSDEKFVAACEIVRSKKTGSDKQKKLAEIFGINRSDKRALSVLRLICGNTCKADDLYGKELDDNVKIDLSAIDDVKFSQIQEMYDDGCLLDGIKAIYDWSVLSDILGGEKSISAARVHSYDTHKYDLSLLKKYVREQCADKYKNVFRYDVNAKNYAAYIGMDKHKSYKKATRDAFYKFMEEQVFVDGKDGFIRWLDDNGANDARVRYERGEFLPKQKLFSNGVIPHQLHLNELSAILNNAKCKYAFLNETDSRGKSVAERVEELLKFRIPYYVGPLGGGKFAWAVRHEGMQNVKITPWNFDEVIDKDASEEKFIKNMTCKCTYIPTEDVLPTGSLLYGEAVFLSELNNLKVNGQKDDKLIDWVYELAHTEKKITKSKIWNALKIHGCDMTNITKESITGIDGDMKSSLSSYILFNKTLEGNIENEREMCEEIILWSTLVSDKDRLKKRITAKYGKKLTEKQIKEICGFTFTKWGRLSRTLLDGITSEKALGAAGECLTVIQSMRLNKTNLSETLTAARWGFDKAILEYNERNASGDKQKIDDMYCSPSVKRALRRTLAVVEEIVKIMGCATKKIMIETARGGTKEQKGKRTVSRKEKLLGLYKSVKSDTREFAKAIAEIDGREERDFSSKRLYAYYMQNCRCMYSGERIEINELFDKNKYDFDHIYPQSKVNDDSFDNNLALVKKEYNARKTDKYPLPADIQIKMRGFWDDLHKHGFISDEKYKRLTRTSELTPSDIADFESRQLVMTQQSTKLVAQILKANFGESEIVYSKASKAAEFKNRFGEFAEKAGCAEKYRAELVKVRELNNLHHAKDAYINIVVGNVLNTEYGHDISAYYKNKSEKEMRSDYTLFRRGVKGAWDPVRDIPLVFDTYYTDNCRVVRFVNEDSGQLFDATIKTAGTNDKLIPLKAKGKISDTKKYGGYDSAKTAYFALVKSKDKKGNAVLSLEAIPVMAAILQGGASRYVSEKCGLVDSQIVIPKIRLSSLLIVNGSPVYLKGKTGVQIIFDNAAELFTDRKQTAYLKRVVSFNKKFGEAAKYKKHIEVNEEYDGITREQNIELYETFIQKLGANMYASLPMSKQKGQLLSYKAQFIEMPLEIQCVVLCKLAAFTKADSVHLNLTDFKDENGKVCVKTAGVNLMNKFVNGKNVKWVVQSPTGQYRQVIDFDKFLP